MRVTVTQKDRSVGLAQHRRHRDRPAMGRRARCLEGSAPASELKQVIYRGEGELVDEDETPRSGERLRTPLLRPSAPGPIRRGARRVVITVHIAAPGASGEKIDEGLFRGVVDPATSASAAGSGSKASRPSASSTCGASD